MEYKEAFAAVERDEAYIVEMLQRLIAVDTSVPPGDNYGRLIELVEPDLRRFGFECERVLVPEEKVRQISPAFAGERPNLVARRGGDGPRVSTYAHMDVVPPGEGWTRDPFGGELIDGKVYGRGTVDMKGSIACFMGAMKVLHEMKIEPRFKVDLLLCTDEEVGVYPGARYLAEEGYFSSHLLWLELSAILEGAALRFLGAAGRVVFEITGRGRSCHTGMNYLGVNAIEEMAPVIDELLALRDEVQERTSRIAGFPRPGATHDRMSPMFTLAVISGGTKGNIVPDECRLTVDRRYIVDEEYDDVVAEVEAAVARARERSALLDISIKATHVYVPVEVDPEMPAARKSMAARAAVRGEAPVIAGGISASTDMGFVARALEPEKLNSAGFGLVRAENPLAHCADEFVYVEDLVSMTKELVHYLAF